MNPKDFPSVFHGLYDFFHYVCVPTMDNCMRIIRTCSKIGNGLEYTKSVLTCMDERMPYLDRVNVDDFPWLLSFSHDLGSHLHTFVPRSMVGDFHRSPPPTSVVFDSICHKLYVNHRSSYGSLGSLLQKGQLLL